MKPSSAPRTLATHPEPTGQSSLFFAVEAGLTEVVRYLLEQGAQVDVRDELGRTPVDLVRGDRGEARSKEIVSLLERVRR